MSAIDEGFPEHKEEFEVVLCRDGVPPGGAQKTDDFTRVRVVKSSSFEALTCDEARGVAGFTPFRAAKPGFRTEEEVKARERELGMLDGGPLDKSKI